MGAMAGVQAEASTPNSQGHRNPTGWYGDIMEAGRFQAKKAIRKGYLRGKSGERSCMSRKAMQYTLMWKWSPHSDALNTQVYSLTGLRQETQRFTLRSD